MNTYFETLEKDINRVYDLSHRCRGEVCRELESETDALRSELDELKMKEADIEGGRLEELSNKLRDTYKHLSPDTHI